MLSLLQHKQNKCHLTVCIWDLVWVILVHQVLLSMTYENVYLFSSTWNKEGEGKERDHLISFKMLASLDWTKLRAEVRDSVWISHMDGRGSEGYTIYCLLGCIGRMFCNCPYCSVLLTADLHTCVLSHSGLLRTEGRLHSAFIHPPLVQYVKTEPSWS